MALQWYMNGVVYGSIVFPSFSVLNRLSSAETLIDLKRLLALRWKRKDTTGEPNSSLFDFRLELPGNSRT